MTSAPLSAIRAALAALFIMGGFEWAKESLFDGQLTHWQSHILTILLTMALAAWLTARVQKQAQRLVAQTREVEKQSARFLQTLIDVIPVAVYYKDVAGRYQGCNRKFCDVVGLSAEQLRGKTVEELWPPELAREYRQRDLEMFEQPGQQQYEFRVKDAQGNSLDVLFGKATYCDEHGQTTGLVGAFFDISATKEAQRALARSEAKYRNLFESANDAIIVMDAYRFLDCNQKAADLIGGRREDVIGRAPTDFAPPKQADGRPSAEAALGYTMAALNGKVQHFEWLSQRLDGSVIDVEVSLSRVEMEGEFRLQTIVRDITARKRAAQALRASSELLRSVVENVPARIFWKDRESRYLGCNTAFARDGGDLTPVEMIGKNDFDMGWRDQAELYRTDDRAVMESGAARLGFEEPQTTPEGDTIWLRTSKVPLRDAQGQVVGILGMYEDITEQRRNAEELANYRQHLENLVTERTASLARANNRLQDTQFAMDSVGIGIHWVDYETGRLTYANRQAAALLGYQQSELIGKHVWEIDPQVSMAVYREIREKIRDQGQCQFETRQRTADGREIPVEMTVYFSACRDYEPPKFIGFVADISRRKEAESALVTAREAAETANSAKSEFLANMSHEIRTPLNAILGLNQLMRNDDLPPRQLERLTKMEIAGRHLLSLINDILDLSKIEAGRLELDSANFHLSAVLDNVVSMIKETARDKGLELEVDPDGVPLWLRGDATRLRQSLLNFASNAVKFTERGKISLRAALLQESAQTLRVRFEVRDSGIGIEPAAQGRLFSAFQQADGSTARRFGGTGLGLALTKRLVQLMDGEVGVTSEPGVGSTFWFDVPLQRGHGPMPRQMVTDAIASPEILLRRHHVGARILLTEDNLINVEVVQEILSAVGLDVVAALNGQEALDIARDGQGFDLILMDMQMPVMDGLAATRALRALPDFAHVPILALTANAFAEDRAACFAAGMNDIVTKPVEIQSLYASVLYWLSSRTAPEVQS